MDGYAARASDLAAGAPLPVAFAVSAGEAAPPLPAGAAARIFTGAMLPAGSDTVVQQEVAEVRPDGRVVLPALPVGTNVRPRGEVFVVGSRVAAVGELVTPGRVGLLAAAGAARLTVIPRPRVAVVLTGNELVGVGSRPGPGQIRDSNGAMLAALAAEAGLVVTAVNTVGDELEATSAALARAAAGADLVVTTGGVSVGDRDLVPAAVGRLGGETVLHKVAMQPGKPILVARLGDAWLVGLPGNPVSALVGWRMFVRPLAEALAGDGAAFAEVGVTAELEAAVRNGGDRTQLRPAVLHRAGTGLTVSVRRWHGSHDVMAAAPANALARLEVGADLAAGAPVACYPLPWRWTA